jgi:hypothetical protein
MTYYLGWVEEHPFTSLDDEFDSILCDFAQEWADYWGIGEDHAPDHLDVEDWETANEMVVQARRICDAAVALSRRGLPDQLRGLPEVLQSEAEAESRARKEALEEARRVLDPEFMESETWKRIEWQLRWLPGEAKARRLLFEAAPQLYLFEAFGQMPETLTRRTFELLAYLVRAKDITTREYLRRVALCYIRDMTPELAVMSRAVMEAAMRAEELGLEARVEANLRTGGKRHPVLADWIQAASDEGLLDVDARMAAERLKNHGNDAIHNVPRKHRIRTTFSSCSFASSSACIGRDSRSG